MGAKLATFVLACCFLLWTSHMSGQTPNAPALPVDAAGHPDLSGYWELRWDGRSVPAAMLTPIFQQSGMAAKARQDDLWAVRRCTPVGMPAVMDNQATIDLRQSPKVIGIIAKVPSSARYIYTDGRSTPPKDELDPTTNGFSIGRWEGDTLVVETIAFNERGITTLPGGGVRTPESRLTERYHLINGGRELAVTFTWNDPKVFQKPHTYEYRYDRTEITNPRVFSCDANDQDRASFLERAIPAQIPNRAGAGIAK